MMSFPIYRHRTRFIGLCTAFTLAAVVAGAGSLHPWSEQARLQPNDPGMGDYFGQRVNLQGEALIVGDEMDSSPADRAGSAYIFTRRNGLVWSQKAKLTASDQVSNDRFGSSVGISGTNAVVGAYSDDLPSGKTDAGSAYVFEAAGASWTQRAKLTASDKELGDNFGAAADIDGNTIVVGAPLNDDPVSGADVGATYVFTRSGTNWVQQAILLASDRSADDRFGNAVAIAGDTIVVGAWNADSIGAAYSGAAYVFVRSGTNWTQQARLVSGDIVAGDSFGRAVAISGDTIVIGADGCDDGPSLQASGAGYVFTRSGVTWSPQAKLRASDRAANDQLGISAAVCSNLAALATVNSSPAGAAYVFARSGTNWTEQVRLVPTNVVYGHGYAKAVALSGETLAATADKDSTPATYAGSAYVLILDDDGDGLSDGFEQNWGTQPDVADTDTDGASDYAEYLAGSNPTNDASSGFQAQGLTCASDGAGVVLTWLGLMDRLYDVQQTPDLNVAWGTVATNLPGTGTSMAYTNTDTATGAFMRVMVRLAP